MDLLFVGTNRGGGGTESHFVSLATSMAAAGHRVAAVVRPGDVMYDALADDGRVELFPACFERGVDLRATLAVRRACRAVRPDAMIGTFKREYRPLMAVAAEQRVPLFLFRHLEDPLKPSVTRLVSWLVERMVLPSEYMRERMIENGVPRARTSVLFNPVDTARFRPRAELRHAARARLGFAPGDVIVAYLGRFEPQKGVHVLGAALAGAMARAPQLHALWVGHGQSEPRLRDEIARTPSADRHLFRPWANDVRDYYAAADVVVLPSTGSETFGRVLIEAQACELPVLGSRIGGIPETMEPEVTGRLLPAGDVAAWTDALVALAGNAETRARMGRAGRDHVRARFDSAVIADDFTRLLVQSRRARVRRDRRTPARHAEAVT